MTEETQVPGHIVLSVLKALDILEAFAEGDHMLGITDLSKRLGLAKSTVYNLVSTLKYRGYIEEDPMTNRYSLGVRLLELSQAVRANVEIRDRAAPLLRELAQSSREAVYLTILHRNRSVYIYSIEASGRLPSRSPIGERVPLHCTAVGKAKLAFMPEEQVDRIISTEELTRYTENTITDPERLRHELARIRQLGYAVDYEEHEVGIRCVGAPIRDDSGAVIASCSVSGPTGRMQDERIAELGPQVAKVAATISQRLGYSGSR